MGFGDPWNSEAERVTGALEREGKVGASLRPGSSLALGDHRGPVHENGRRRNLSGALGGADQETLAVRGDGVVVSDLIGVRDEIVQDHLRDPELEGTAGALNIHRHQPSPSGKEEEL